MNPSLCTHCSQIPFECLRLPTTRDLESCNAGTVPVSKWPFKSTTIFQSGRNGGCLCWRLGLRSRVEESAATCPLCATITRISHDVQEVHEKLAVPELREAWCCAIVCPIARFGPEGVPDKGKHGDKNPWKANLRRLSIAWGQYGAEDGETEIEPGEMDHEPRYWVVLPCCFQAEGGGERHFGGRWRSDMVDGDMPARWLRTCLGEHGNACAMHDAKAPIRQARLLRLVDVQQKCLVEISRSESVNVMYTALSYVWGAKQRLVLLENNIRALKLTKAFDGTVANTIQDAMKFTDTLGYRYIWIDALCIIQDSNADKADQIANMSNIYSQAVVTIVAAAGKDSEAGLPGVREKRNRKQIRIETNSEVTLLTMLNIRPRGRDTIGVPLCIDPFENTVWDTRGWTLQERELSGRTIIFNDNQVAWKCGLHTESEETNTASPLANFAYIDNSPSQLSSSRRTWYVLDDPSQQLWYRFRQLVLDFSSRSLTVQGDAQDAFAAVLQQAQSLSGDIFIWGMPAGRFDVGLCWEPNRKGLTRRTGFTTLKTTSLERKVPFPSWSWLGWIGQVRLLIEDRHVEEGLSPETMCHVLRNTPLRLIPVSRLATDRPGRPNPFPKIKSKSPLAISLGDILAHCPELTLSRLADIPDDQLIFFWSECAKFTLSDFKRQDMDARDTYLSGSNDYYYRDVLDTKERVVGRISGSGENDGIGMTHENEFVMIATRAPSGFIAKKIALQIKRRDGIAYRVNIAEIDEVAWKAKKPQWTLNAIG